MSGKKNRSYIFNQEQISHLVK